jgi:MFS family permease
MESKVTFKDFKESINLAVVVAALGYFVDMFDITLFGVVRTDSLKALGYTDPSDLLKYGVQLYNLQMIGMMIGGIIWGVLADKKGRTKVIFASIFLYSIGNIANAFVTNFEMYAVCRFLTGVGLAGELGAAITLVAESLPVRLRGLGTTIVATMGLLGSVAAALFGKMFHWQAAYIIGGVMGIGLLFMRYKLADSSHFTKAVSDSTIERGRITMLFEKGRFPKYLYCILAGAPIYFITGILFTFSPEIMKGLGYNNPFSAGDALLYGTIGLTVGDLFSGLLSQKLQSRKKSIFILLTAAIILTAAMVFYPHETNTSILVLCFLLGICAGYWAVLITTAAEQFGTNLRGTVASTVPNFVRGSAVIATTLFFYLKVNLEISAVVAVTIVGTIWFGLAFFGVYKLKETFSTDLNFIEK